MNKHKIRRMISARVRTLPEEVLREKSEAACGYLAAAEEFQRAQVVMMFHSLPDEIGTQVLVEETLREGKKLLFPVTDVEAGVMSARIVKDLEAELERGPYGIWEPKDSCEAAAIEAIDLVVAPGRAFDRSGNRLGRGGGFYDRFLSKPRLGGQCRAGRAYIIGLAFSFQLLDEIPVQSHDRPVDALATEEGVVRFAR